MLSVDIGAIIVFLIIWILLIVLTRLFFNPIRKVMSERNNKIAADRDSAEKAVTDHEKIVRKIEEDIKAARIAAIATRTKLEKDALQEKAKILSEVSLECREQIKQAQSELGREMERLKAELESESELLAEKVEIRLLN